MVWEASSQGNGFVHLEDCLSMYHRVQADKSSNEPYRILNVLDFASYDDQLQGTISTVQVHGGDVMLALIVYW